MQSRSIALVFATATLVTAPVEAQRLGPPPAHIAPQVDGVIQPAPVAPPAPRWGGTIGGRWEGGMRAPGGWQSYRRPARGWRLPGYWQAPGFIVTDFSVYGLAAPPYGYRWVRYYDDAVLVDDGGRVWEWQGGIDWDRAEAGYGYGYGATSSGYSGYGATYATPPAGSYSYEGTWTGRVQQAPPPAIVQQPPVVQTLPPQGYVQSYGAGGYASGVTVNGQFYPTAPGTVTSVTVQSAAPVVTTEVTEYVEEVRTVRRAAPRRVVRRAWHPRPRACRCACCR